MERRTMAGYIEVSEMYVAPQGEGPNMGRPSLFVRFRRCTLQCTWCDSRFTWDENDPAYQKYETYEPHELVGAMLRRSLPHPDVRRVQAVVLTGGEPLLWQRELREVLEAYRHTHAVPVEVETSGTIIPSEAMLLHCNFVVSHKLASSHNSAARDYLWNETVVRRLLVAGGGMLNNITFKSVVDPTQDAAEVEPYLHWLAGAATRLGVSWQRMQEHIYLMPQGRDAAEVAAAQPYVIELAQVYGVRCTTRMHVIAYGHDRRR